MITKQTTKKASNAFKLFHILFPTFCIRVDGTNMVSREPTDYFALCQAMVSQVYPSAKAVAAAVS